MNNHQNFNLYILGGISGIVGTICYVIAITIPMSPIITYMMAMSWPILSIVFVFSLYRYIAIYKQSAYNQLALLMACLAFAMVAMMISIQLSVRFGINEYISNSSNSEQEILRVMQNSIRLVDMGLDVSWDLFIGISLIFLSIVLKGNKSFGLWWSLPAVMLGIMLIVLNVITFPWPPDTQGLIDIGPAIGLYIIALSTRLLSLGLKMKRL